MSTPARPRTTPSQRRWWVVGTVLVGLATALVVWYGIALNTNKPNWFYAGHEKITDSSVTVIYDVHREPDRPVVCRLVAENENHEVVGTRDVTVPPRGAGSTRERSVVQTTSRPLVGNVTGCWYPEG
ncbi:DUF4307 domain-containing protein [Kytococcus schroeteri]|uniref:DUF4307 domain-containing protein n=2 Tax=Kytococcus schroeteri TaxID=138300 RepID=A0A2I1P8L0_9MICO|nr:MULTISPECIES: DUF4307 domain-containing protein [Kytococcus]OFS14327.1 hypothetical protein HMPREF3099_04300 [Kytococcus sp. HMSC28H12]PKZ40969.1 DUF4307 domain-containing protein [Kytococcus schroeteri]